MKYYSLKKIKKENADYNLIIGERSNGKTYAVLEEGLKDYVARGKQMAYVRRWREDITGNKASETFAGLAASGDIKKITHDAYDSVKYWRSCWYLYNTEKDEKDPTPFCYAFALSSQEHYKSASYPNIETVAFDEFLTRGNYLPDEFNLFMNLLSTIIRQRSTVKIYMMANTVNKYAPYFKEMGITEVEKMIPGDLMTYKKGALRIAVEYCENNAEGKPSDKYFTFNAKSVNMITKGAWEIDEYPKAQTRWTDKNVVQRFYLIFNDHYLTGNIVSVDGNLFLFFHRKKESRILHPESDIVYCDYSDYRWNYHSSLTRPVDDITKTIMKLFQIGKAFYADDETGEILRNYVLYSVEKDGLRRV